MKYDNYIYQHANTNPIGGGNSIRLVLNEL